MAAPAWSARQVAVFAVDTCLELSMDSDSTESFAKCVQREKWLRRDCQIGISAQFYSDNDMIDLQGS